MASGYDGVLSKKVPMLSALGAGDEELCHRYESAALVRHIALFAEFGLEAPDPNDACNPLWRELALAMAKRHVPAFTARAGRPATNEEENICWLIASYHFQIKLTVSLGRADQLVADHFGVESDIVQERLKYLRKKVPFKPGGPFDDFIRSLVQKFGREKAAEALESALTPDQAFADMVKAEIEKIARFPYE